MLLFLILSMLCLGTDEVVFIDTGRSLSVFVQGWEESDRALAGRSDLEASHSIRAGDFRVRASLRMINQQGSAASFFLDDNHFGFEGARNTLFVNGSLFGGLHLLEPSPEVFDRGSWIEFEAVREGGALRFLVNGETRYEVHDSGTSFTRFGFRPMRSTMQIRAFSADGNLELRNEPEMLPPGYTIPLIDLSDQTHRQVIVDREPGQYLGHPTTVLLEDNRTMIAVYPKGHGRGGIVMKRSTDAGVTWSERLPVPESWATSKEVPTIHRVIDAAGIRRLIMFSGLYPIRMAVSEDDGHTWSQLAPIGDFGGIVTMGCVERLANGHYMALFHDDGRFLRGAGTSTGFDVFKTLSRDGGLTWSDPVVIASHDSAHLCEPGLIRSPDGRRLAVLLRENSRRYNSFVIFSDDEGQTWSEPRQLPAALTGDRHTGRYADDGRLFISFRDTTRESPTQGDWVAWVGTYEDIVHGREGQYRVRLMDNHHRWDCAYPGVEHLPDGTFVTTTYGHWTEGASPYIVSVRLKLAELDAMATEALGQ